MWSASPIWLYASMWACHQEPSLEGTHSKTTYSKCFFSSKGMSSSGHLFRVRWAPALRAGRGLHGFWMTSDWHGTKTNSGAQLHSPAPGKLLCQRLASESCTEGLFAWGRRGDYEAHWVGKWFYKEKPSEQIIEIGPWTQETRTEVCFLVPTWKFWQKKGRKRRKKGRRSSGQT